MQPLAGRAPALSEQVYRRLVDAIADGSLPAGHLLRQEELAAQLGVSRQPLSHALHLLRHEGLVLPAGKRGLVVAPLPATRVQDMFQARAALNGLAAQLAARRAGTGAIVAGPAFAQVLTPLAMPPAGSTPARLAGMALAFDDCLHQLSGNSALAEMMAGQRLPLLRALAQALATPGRRAALAEELSGIVAAVLAGDAQTAAGLAFAQTERMGRDCVALLARADAES